MLRIFTATDDTNITLKMGNRKILYEFQEQIDLFGKFFDRIKPHVVVWEITPYEFYIDLKEPYATFIYRWLKGIELGDVLVEDIQNSELLNYIHGEP